MNELIEQYSEMYRHAGQPDTRAVIRGEKWRFTVLTPSLIRMEWSDKGIFEDRATQAVINRAFPLPEFQIVETEDELQIFTKCLQLVYDKKIFSRNGLSVRMTENSSGWQNYWHYGEQLENLGGTARTLDNVNGACSLENGVLARCGMAILDDSHSMIITDEQSGDISSWVQPRDSGIIDIYFWGYGHKYQQCMRDFYHLCGKAPLLPRWALGNWWSRYYKYTESSYKKLIQTFEERGIPFSVAVLDMDWHLVDIDPKYGVGWTGYSWNRDFFPDPKGFMDWLHTHHLKITLNVHPADGVRAFEDLYPRVAQAMGIDPATEHPVFFDAADPHFMDVYFRELHHPLEDDGVDFWWIDWQQGSISRISGLDPLWILNHFHYLDSVHRGRRAITFSRYCGPGSHRYPIGFSGDTHVTWESLRFQPYFTATASNIGYGWWSHDIGGHMYGYRDDELATRWVQLGVFSPINRLHSTCNDFNRKEPWMFNQIACSTMEYFLRLRHELLPYLYTMNHAAHYDDVPIVRPMYWLEPDEEEAYNVPNEFAFGSELICAPVTEPCDRVSLTAEVKVRLPAGKWFDFFDGTMYNGDRTISVWRPIECMPLFAKAGAIVPLQDITKCGSSTDNPHALRVMVFPGNDSSFTLWEDDGNGATECAENWAATEMTLHGDTFTIYCPSGNTAVLPGVRSWECCFRGTKNTEVSVCINGNTHACSVSYDEEFHTLCVNIGSVDLYSEIQITLCDGFAVSENDLNGKIYRFLDKAQIEFNLKTQLFDLVRRLGKDAVPSMLAMDLPRPVVLTICELLTA